MMSSGSSDFTFPVFFNYPPYFTCVSYPLAHPSTRSLESRTHEFDPETLSWVVARLAG
jgi:hypothetical protein